MKVGLIAGGGNLPYYVCSGALEAGYDVFVAAIDGYALPSDFDQSSDSFRLGEFGRLTKRFREENCTHVCLAGQIDRPDFKALKPDFKTLTKLPGAMKAARRGDDSLLSYVVETFEAEGFDIISPQDLCQGLLLEEGHLGDIKLSAEHRDDTERALKTALEMGRLDIGQGAVVAQGLVLAVEAQEGTDAMLSRVAGLPMNIRGSEEARAGVLAKMVKPGQEERVDLPTIGPRTVELAQVAGLAGIAAVAGRCFVIDKNKVQELADQYGLFVIGLPPSGE